MSTTNVKGKKQTTHLDFFHVREYFNYVLGNVRWIDPIVSIEIVPFLFQ